MRSFSPSFKVLFRDLNTGTLLFDATADVVSIQTTKSYGRGCGTWRVALTSKRVKSGRRYDELLVPNNIAEIWMCAGGAGDKSVCVMIGLIDRAACHKVATEEGLIIKQVIISGSDLGKLLMTEIGWDISAAQMQIGSDNFVNWINRFALLEGKPSGLVKETFNVAKNGITPMSRLIDTAWVEDADDWHTLNESGYMLEQTTIWEAMKRVSNDPWNMLYADFADEGGPLHIGLERLPLDEIGCVLRGPDKTITVPEELIDQVETGVSDAERVNLVTLQTPINTYIADGNAIDITMTHKESTRLDVGSIRSHGFKAYIPQTQFFPPSVKALNSYVPVDVYRDIAARSDQLWSWFSMNHEYKSGTYTSHGLPHARAGWKFIDEASKESYLIETVAHTLLVHPQVKFTTQFQVTRGVSLAGSR